MTPKTIIVGTPARSRDYPAEIHLDPINDNVELSIGCRQGGYHENARVRLDRAKRLELAAALIGDDLNAIVKGLALDLVKEAA